MTIIVALAPALPMAEDSGSAQREYQDGLAPCSAPELIDEGNECFADDISRAALPPDHEDFQPFIIQVEDGSAWLELISVNAR